MSDILTKNLDSGVVSFIEENVKSLYVCCSGGADSVYLSVAMRHLFPCRPLNILHYNHNVREESEIEAVGVERLAKDLGAKFFYGRRVSQSNENITEELLRKDRYSFFQKTLKCDGGNCLILGQHLNDRAESLIMRLARGSGLSGLIAPKSIQKFEDGHIRLRPLINIKKSNIEQYLVDAGISFFVDKSNFSEKFLRNVVRLKVFSLFDKIFQNRDWLNGVRRSISMLEESSCALSYFYDKEFSFVNFTCNKLDLEPFVSKPAAIIRELMVRWLAYHQILANLKAETVDKIIQAIFSGTKFKISAGTEQFIVFKPKSKKVKNAFIELV